MLMAQSTCSALGISGISLREDTPHGGGRRDAWRWSRSTCSSLGVHKVSAFGTGHREQASIWPCACVRAGRGSTGLRQTLAASSMRPGGSHSHTNGAVFAFLSSVHRCQNPAGAKWAWTMIETVHQNIRSRSQRQRQSQSRRFAMPVAEADRSPVRRGSIRRRKPPPVIAPRDESSVSENGYSRRRPNYKDDVEDNIEDGYNSWRYNGDDNDDDDERSYASGFLRPASSSGGNVSTIGWRNALLAGTFVMGIGAGIFVDSVLNVEATNIASREFIDRQTPNPDICIANGMSAMVLDQRLFISFNPFNVYVSQAEVKPGCVLLQSNWRVLESRGLVSSQEVQNCKKNMNTFGFVGDLRQAPEVSCVYHSESAENLFLKDPTKAVLGDGFQPRDFTKAD